MIIILQTVCRLHCNNLVKFRFYFSILLLPDRAFGSGRRLSINCLSGSQDAVYNSLTTISLLAPESKLAWLVLDSSSAPPCSLLFMTVRLLLVALTSIKRFKMGCIDVLGSLLHLFFSLFLSLLQVFLWFFHLHLQSSSVNNTLTHTRTQHNHLSFCMHLYNIIFHFLVSISYLLSH